MNNTTLRCRSRQLSLTLLSVAFALPAFAQQPSAAERAAMLKATLAASQAVLQQYEWVETTVLIQSAKDAGKVSLDILEPNKRARLNFRDYLKPGDNLGVEVDLTSNRLLGLTVKTHLDSDKDAVTLDVRMSTLNDGTSYADSITLRAPAKKLTVNVDNSGYRKTK
jgi:hypothetical protein